MLSRTTSRLDGSCGVQIPKEGSARVGGRRRTGRGIIVVVRGTVGGGAGYFHPEQVFFVLSLVQRFRGRQGDILPPYQFVDLRGSDTKSDEDTLNAHWDQVSGGRVISLNISNRRFVEVIVCLSARLYHIFGAHKLTVIMRYNDEIDDR